MIVVVGDLDWNGLDDVCHFVPYSLMDGVFDSLKIKNN